MKTNRINHIKPQTKSTFITFAIAIGAFALSQTLIATGKMGNQMAGLMVPICYNVILAVSLNLTVGILGELSLGHAGFMCVGAFASSVFSVLVKDDLASGLLRFALAMLIGALTAALFGLIVGIPVLRLQGDYLAIVTLAFGEIIKNIVSNLYLFKDKNGFVFGVSRTPPADLTTVEKVLNGPNGVTGIPKSSTFTIAFVMVLITLFVVTNLVNSRAGRAIKSIRDNRIAAQSVGISIPKYKLLALVISAMFAGVAGVLYSHSLTILTATSQNFGYNMSIMILVYVVLGGIGSIRGSMIAATLLTILPEKLRFLSDKRMLIYAIVLIIIMLFNNSPAIAGIREKVRRVFRVKILRKTNTPATEGR
ncbi:MAG: branched-chain amino acid ABC transporter permease [Oscillospiraceae bacterium]|jgi:branched-chain amino acid transport system permease protein|nr:branched-chain amino acid ABC transporter permease [Oscillospiraceae bacterium]